MSLSHERPYESLSRTNPAPPARVPPSVPRVSAPGAADSSSATSSAPTSHYRDGSAAADPLDSSLPRRTSSTASASATSQSLIRSNLLSELMPAGSAAHARASLPQAPDWLRTRGGSISIAPPGSTLVVTESTLPETRPLSGFNEASQAEQEQLLLEDLLYALVGIEGRYIRLVPSTKAGDDRVNFVASPYIKDASLVESLSRMLPLCSAYFSVQMYVQVHSRWEHGLVTNAFAAALRTILKEYLVLVAQLEFQFSQRKLTLLRAWYYLQSSFHSFLKLEQLCQKVHRTVGGAFLNVIHQSMTLAGDAATKSLYTHLLVHASIPYFDMLNAWLSQGVLRDVHGEFQICEHTERSKENVRKDFNDTYWDERYTVRQEKVPIFLAGVSEKILTTGKYLNVIRECARAIPPRDSSTDGILPLASFTPNERAYLDWIGTSYAHASRLLLDVLMHENDLLGHLRSLKRYFLGAQGDFFVDFMDAAEKEMEGKTKDVVITKLRTHLELALRSSRASIDPYGGDLSCQIQPFNLVQQLELIHSISATGGGGGGAAGGKDGAAGSAAQQQSALVASKRNEFLKGHEAFELSYRVRWPLSLVLSKKTLTKYQLLFRHLFAIKHAERQLNRCWATHQSLKELHFIDRKYHHAHGLRHRMLHFFTSMAYYIMVEVLEPNWHQLEQALMQVTTVDQVNYNAVNRVLRLHHNFLDTCLKQCLLTNQTLLKTIHKVSITALTFAQHAETSINARLPDSIIGPDADSSEDEEHAQRRRAEAEDEFEIQQRRRRPMNLKQRARHIEDATFAIRQSVQNEEHEKFIQDMAEKFDKLLFDFLSALRAKSAFQSTDAHFTNLYHRLDYNDWYSQQYQSQSTTKSNNVVSPPAPAAAAASSAAAHHPRQLSSY